MSGLIRSSSSLLITAAVALLGACSAQDSSPVADTAVAPVVAPVATDAPPPSPVAQPTTSVGAPATEVGSPVPTPAPSSPTSVLFDGLDPGATGEWAIVNDGVMGGMSSSSVSNSADGVVFSGSVSLDNNGGFASIRTAFVDVVDLSGFSDLVVEATGDGKTYVLELRTDESDVSYWQRFTPTLDMAASTLPLDDFAPHTRFGEPMDGGPGLDPSRVGSVAVYILDKQVGEFRLVISSISAR